jgi:hypothetical protein
MLEQGWIHEYGERRHFHPETPLEPNKTAFKFEVFYFTGNSRDTVFR